MKKFAEFCDLLEPLPLPEEMRQWDSHAADLGLSPAMLMENAGHVACDVILNHCRPVHGTSAWIIMGNGNNGGDAACVARLLADQGCRPIIFHAQPPEAAKGPNALHLALARANGALLVPLADLQLAIAACLGAADMENCSQATRLIADYGPPRIIVDGLLGTGFAGTLRPEAQTAIERINALSARLASCFVLAIDVPSGLNAINGKPSPIAVRASATVSLAAAKPGLVLPEAATWVGSLYVGDIGLPAPTRTPVSHYLLDGHALGALPKARPDSYKNSFGHVLILGGAPGLSGAAHLAAISALRTGAGLASVAAPESSIGEIKNGKPEIMTLALGKPGHNQWPNELSESLQELIQRSTALVIGPGIGRNNAASAFLSAILELPQRPPAVIDADALILLSRNRHLFSLLTRNDILTPHPGEASALLNTASSHIQNDRPNALASLCRLSNAAVVLKGAGTLVGQKNAPVFISPYAVAALAMGGSGDVLAGCIASLFAQQETSNLQALLAAATGVALHAQAGRICAQNFPKRGCLASDLADALPQARAICEKPPATFWERRLPWPL